MPNSSFPRISITLPTEVLAAANRLARVLDRPRSWVFAEALRRMDAAESGAPAEDRPAVERAAASARLDPGALARLQADLSLSAEERVRAAEERVRNDASAPQRPPNQILCFNRFEEYQGWKARSRSPG